jgi:basic membrane protein A
VAAMKLTVDQQTYIDTAVAVREAALADEDRRLALETRTTRSARRRLWALVAAMAALGGLATVMLFGALFGGTVRTVAFYGSPDDGGWGTNLASGLDRAMSEFELDLRIVEPLVEPLSEFRQLAADGPDLIISDATPTFIAPGVFADFPEVRFGVIDGFIDSPNTATILFANEQGSFLVGAAAALKSETGVIGFVGGFRLGVLEEFRAGYEAGARYIDPDIEILATYIQEPFAGKELFFVDPFLRPDLGNQRAVALYERGADVVFHVASASGFGVFDAAVEQSDPLGRHLWAIGVDNDQWFQADERQREHVLTSMIKRGDVAVYLLISDLVADSFVPGVREIGVVDDAFAFSRQGSGMTTVIIDRLDEIELEIAAGRIDVPTDPSGAVLDLDPLPDEFEEIFADMSIEEMATYRGWLLDTRPVAMSEACFPSGTVSTCGQLLLSEVDQWLSSLG